MDKTIPKQPEPKMEDAFGRKIAQPKCPKCKGYPGQLHKLDHLRVGKCQHCGEAITINTRR